MMAKAEDKRGRRRISPYQKVRRAYQKGRCCRLNFKDVAELMSDDAIAARAQMDEDEFEEAPRDFRR